MRRLAFIIAVLGMLVLVFMLAFGKPIYVENYGQLEELEINQRVFVAGKVAAEKVISGGRKILALENEIELVCECVGEFKEKRVEVDGVVSEFKGQKQIEVLKINVN